MEILIAAASVLVSAVMVLLTMLHNANENLKQQVSDKRPMLLVSLYGNMDLKAKNKTRSGYRRLLAQTDELEELETLVRSGIRKDGTLLFLRLRNDSVNGAFHLRIHAAASEDAAPVLHYELDMLAGNTEYLLALPSCLYPAAGEYAVSLHTDISYRSVAGEEIIYSAELSLNSSKEARAAVHHSFTGRYRKKGGIVLTTFRLDTGGLGIPTKEVTNEADSL